MPNDERTELRHRVRLGERTPHPNAAILRGGPDTLSLLKSHAKRLNRAFVFDGAPVFGISVFVATDDLGPASERTILSTQLGSYSWFHRCVISDLDRSGFVILPTFARPHFSILIPSTDAVVRLAAAFGQSRLNKYAQ